MKKNYLFALLLVSCGMAAQTINFPDPVFKTRLVSGNITFNSEDGTPVNIDSNGDGEIQFTEAQVITKINIYEGDNVVITNLTGIEHFTNLKVLNIESQNISSIDLTGLNNLEEFFVEESNTLSLNTSGATAMKYFICRNNPITTLNFSNNDLLISLDIGSNLLASIDISNLSSLKFLDCRDNNLTTLNASGLANLETIICSDNNLTSINLTGLTNLNDLHCYNNHLTSVDLTGLNNLYMVVLDNNELSAIDLSFDNNIWYFSAINNVLTTVDLTGCSMLYDLYLNNNQLVTLDLSENPQLADIGAQNNLLKYINFKNGGNSLQLFLPQDQLYNNPDLAFVCVDENEKTNVLDYLSMNFPNCVVNTYCSFVPGGEYYTLQGTFSYDGNSNGCDSTDALVPTQGFSIDNGVFTDTIIANTSGNYTTGIPSGSYTFTPINPNPEYFAVSPESVTLTFPAESDPYNQNFCITPLGTFNDLEITLLPIIPARPGFDAKYRLIYRNKGTTEQFTGVFFNYSDALLDYVSSTLAPNTTDTGILFWEFNIKPFEQGVIDIVLNVNSPLETPAVINGDTLSFEANIQNPIPETLDQTPLDNTYTLHQTVVGSFDPNDKTCVEGTTINPDMAGEYVTYLIRFENTGTYHAENIVVKDVIDAEKFEISSLQPMQSSHPYVTRINNNTAEFIFENIMLPGVPSEDRHGFVAFKIKTKATLQLNDNFSNTASIYFDYNAPITTNEAVTTLGILDADDFDFANNISVYPNPAAGILNIDMKDTVSANAFEVYNIMGQRVLEVQNVSNTTQIDIARLAAGTYILKVYTDKGAAHTKFIKK